MTDLGVVVAKRYRVVRSLGAGGPSRVWLARDELLGRDVAIKEVTPPTGMPGEEYEALRRRALREARAAARLTHPNVVKIYNVESDAERHWIVMEYVRSRSLLQVLQENGALPVDEVARIGLAILSALEAANQVGVLHRDVKPGNVLIADDGRVVLTDFGSALLDENTGAITRPGFVVGTPDYMAPEQIRTGVSTAESDLWSLGATLYRAVEGRVPYARVSIMATLTALAKDKPDRMSRAGPLKPVVGGLLRRDPQARMGAAEAEDRLRKITARDQTTVPARLSQFAPWRFGRRQWTVAGTIAVASLTLGIVAPQVEGGFPPWAAGAATIGAPARVDRAGPPGPAQPELPAGYVWWHDPTGMKVAFPADWDMLRETSVAMLFRSPDGASTLRVRIWDQPGPLAAALAGEEKRADLPGYRRLRMQALPQEKAAEWEYSYDGPTGRMRGYERAITVAGRDYLLQWRTPLDTWQSDRSSLAVVIESFRPPGD